MSVVTLTWISVIEFFVMFKCPDCGGEIDQGHLEYFGIYPGDSPVQKYIDCPRCDYSFQIFIQRGK